MIKAAKTKKKRIQKLPVKETLRHQVAFETYYLLGEKRTMRRVANAMGLHHASISNWARAFDWHNRIIERDSKLAKRIQEKTEGDLVKLASEHRPTVRDIMVVVKAALQVGVNTIKSGKFRVDTADGLSKIVVAAEKMIRLDLLLMGEPEERREMLIKWAYEEGNGEMPIIDSKPVEAEFEGKNDE